MTCPWCLPRAILSCTPLLLLLAPARASACSPERCGVGPTGPHDLQYLTECRPEPVTAAEKERVVATLPSDGTVTELRPAERTKIEAAKAVLRLHGRETVYDVRVIDVPQAWSGLHGRAVLLLSRPVLHLLSSAELQALVAHEIAHEYLWVRWEAARTAHDELRLREVESACDAIAALTLDQLGIPPGWLARAIEKVFLYNRLRFGVADSERSYPTPGERRRLIAKFTPQRSPP